MKKTGELRFEQELLQALRGPMRAPERNAARARVSRRLEVSLAQLEVGAAGALPLLLDAPPVAASQAAASVAAQAKALAATSSAVGGSAAAAGATATGASVAAAATHPLGVLLTAFALGAGAGGGTLVALSAAHVFETQSTASGQASVASTSLAQRQSSRPALPRASVPALAVPSSEAVPVAGDPPADSALRARAPAPAKGRPAPAKAAEEAVSGAVERAPEADTLTAQQALLDRARSALAHGDGQQALAALSEHARVHPSSELLEEREALTIKSLIASSDFATARARALAFGARYPRSLFLPSIRAALPENP